MTATSEAVAAFSTGSTTQSRDYLDGRHGRSLPAPQAPRTGTGAHGGRRRRRAPCSRWFAATRSAATILVRAAAARNIRSAAGRRSRSCCFSLFAEPLGQSSHRAFDSRTGDRLSKSRLLGSARVHLFRFWLPTTVVRPLLLCVPAGTLLLFAPNRGLWGARAGLVSWLAQGKAHRFDNSGGHHGILCVLRYSNGRQCSVLSQLREGRGSGKRCRRVFDCSSTSPSRRLRSSTRFGSSAN